MNIDLSEKSAGSIVEHQLSRCGYRERFVYSTLAVFAVWLLLL
jgi:hypothetical protein